MPRRSSTASVHQRSREPLIRDPLELIADENKPRAIGQVVASIPPEYKLEAVQEVMASLPREQEAEVIGKAVALVPDERKPAALSNAVAALSKGQKSHVADRILAGVPDDDKREVAEKALAVVPKEQKPGAVGDALAEMSGKDRQKAMHNAGILGPPTQAITNFVWVAIFLTLAVVIVGGSVLGVNAAGGDKTALYGFVGIALGAVVGLLAPSPANGKKE